MTDYFEPHRLTIPVQKGSRLFVRRDGEIAFDRGFKNKNEASGWINGLDYHLDWRAGFTFKIRGDSTFMEIVDRKGVLIKP